MRSRHLLVRGRIVRRMLQRRHVRGARERIEHVVRPTRSGVRGVLLGAGVQRDDRPVRLRRSLVSKGLLHGDRDLRAVRLRVERFLWQWRCELRCVRGRSGVQYGQVRVRRDVLPGRLLHRERHLCALFFGVGEPVRRRWQRVRGMLERPLRHDHRRVLLRFDDVSPRLLQRRHQRDVRSLRGAVGRGVRHGRREVLRVPFGSGVRYEQRTVRVQHDLLR